MLEVRCIWDAAAQLGEGPVWLPEAGALFWVDIKSALIHRYTPADGARRTWRSPQTPGAILPTAAGGLIGTFRDGFHHVVLAGDEVRLTAIAKPDGEAAGNRFNDGKIDRRGRFWAGSMDDAERQASGRLYRLDPDLSCHLIDDGYVVSNGPAFSRDGRTLYHTDTLARTIYAFDFDERTGGVANRRPFIAIPDGEGYPDGMTVDGEDCLWVALWGGWGLRRFDAAGAEIERIKLPAEQVTSCTFAGPDLRDLYITTAAVGLDADQRRAQPLAGGLFHCRPGNAGIAGHRFGEPRAEAAQ